MFRRVSEVILDASSGISRTAIFPSAEAPLGGMRRAECRFVRELLVILANLHYPPARLSVRSLVGPSATFECPRSIEIKVLSQEISSQ